MTNPVDIAIQQIVSNVNDATSKRLVELWNEVESKTCADTWWALSQIAAHLLYDVPSINRASYAQAFVQLIEERYEALRLTQSATGRPN
jgi:hypothetical protein